MIDCFHKSGGNLQNKEESLLVQKEYVVIMVRNGMLAGAKTRT